MKEGLRWVLRKWVSWVWVVVESEIVGRGGEEDGSGGGMRAAVSVVGGVVRGEEEEGWTGFEMGFGSFFNTIVARSTLLETHDFEFELVYWFGISNDALIFVWKFFYYTL